MEAAAIAWLVQTILATLLIDKLDEWIRQVGLADDVEKLKLEIRRVKVVVSAVKGGAIGNEPLAKSLATLKELLYDADDVVDELDYYRLQQQVQAEPGVLVPSNFAVQGVTSDEPEVMAVAERVDDMSRGDDDAQDNSVRKLRSAVWKHFEITRKVNGKPKAECRHCRKEFNCDTKMNGTSSMKKHLEKEHPETCTKKPPGAHPLNPSSTSELIVSGSSSMRKGKRRRSMAWEHFDVTEEENEQPIKARCKYCPTEIKCGPKNGTSGMLAHNRKCKKKSALHNQPSNPSRTGDTIANVTPIVIGDPSSRKRMRAVESAQITSADTHTNWDKNELSSRIQNITSQLQGEVLKRHGSAREVLESLEPHRDLKHLQISGYYGVTTPTWLANNISITTLQTLHLDYCGQLQILPSLENFPFLRKLKLSNLPKVKEVLVPTLEELVLVQMTKLQRCSCTSMGGLSSSLRALQIEKCEALRTFDLFVNHHEFMIEQRSWLPSLTKLIIRDCPRLQVLKPLPPSSTLRRLLISRVSTFPRMEGSSRETLHTLHIGSFAEADSLSYEYPSKFFNESYHEFSLLDDKIMAFHNLRSLKSMIIFGLQNLMYISFHGLNQLVSLKSLEIYKCKNLFSSYILPEHDMPDANCNIFPSLESLSIKSCGISGKCLSLMLRHAPCLKELILEECPYITTVLSIEEEENNPPNLISDMECSSSGNLDDALVALARDGLLYLPLNLMSSLRSATFEDFPRLTFSGSQKGFSRFTSLEKLNIWGCPELLSSLVYKDGSDGQANGTWLLPASLEELHIANYSQETLQLCFPSDLTRLKKLWVWRSPGLESLQLHSCMALEELETGSCGSLTTLGGLQCLGSLRHLSLHNCPGLPPYFESVSRPRGYDLCSRLERLDLSVTSVLTTSFCEHLTSLKLVELRELMLTREQGGALVLLRSMQELGFCCCSDLVELPAGLHTLPSLKRLEILSCPGILRLPETGLPLSLEKLEILHCSKELADECMLLATSKLNVRIVR